MKDAPIPHDDAERVACLMDFGVLDTPSDPDLDRLIHVAQRIFDVPIVLVSLVDEDRQWFKARIGLDATETPRRISFCGHAVASKTLLVVPDALLDPRFADNPLVVGGPTVRFYAGAPLMAGDHCLGTLCVIDSEPRHPSDSDLELLQTLASEVVARLELKRSQRDLEASLASKEIERQALAQAIADRDNAERRHQRFFSISLELLCIAGFDGVFKQLNPAWTKLLGFSQEELMSKPFVEFVHEDDRARTIEESSRLGQPGYETINFENRYACKDGSWRWLSWTASADMQAQCIYAVARDVTRQRKLFARIERYNHDLETLHGLQTSQFSDYDALIDAYTRAGCAIFDADIAIASRIEDRIYTCEAVYSESIDLPRGTRFSLERTYCELVLTCADTVAINEAASDDRILGHPAYEAFQLESYIGAPILVDGELYGTINFSSAARRDEPFSDQQIKTIEIMARHMGVFIERQQAQAALADSELENRTILDTAVDGIITIDEDGTILNANPSTVDLFGYSLNQLRGQKLDVLTPDPDASLNAERAVLTGLGQEVTARHRDGRIFPAELSVSEMTLGGRRMFAAIIRDITERKAVDQMKTEFISIVSHELRTPLTSIRGSLGLLEGPTSAELPPKSAMLIRIARTNTDRLIRLINDILDVEKLEAGKLVLNIEPLETRQVIDNAIQGLEGAATTAGVTMTLGDITPREIAADADRTVQVLTNLIGNAIKFSPRGCNVTISARNQNGFANISIRDEGPGIPLDAQSKLFKKFQQLDSGNTRNKGGTGLGLAISKAIVEQHGGTISLESQEGHGATFSFTLPLKLASPSLLSASRSSLGRRRVLIVEDDKHVAYLLASFLQSEGYTSLHAPTLAEARRLLDLDTPLHGAILDVSLPDGDGLSLIETFQLHNIPVIVVSGKDPEQSGLGLPVLLEWLQKPYDEILLQSALRRAFVISGQPMPDSDIMALIVDDDPSVSEILSQQLALLGIASLHANNGARAVAMANEHQPDLIILDVSMPDMDGYQVVQILRQGATSTIPLIVYTGLDLDNDQRHKLSLGLSRHLTKARTTDEDFIKTVGELLNDRLKRLEHPAAP